MPDQDSNPLTVISRATKAVPFVKYALALAGIAGVIAVVISFGLSLRIGFWGVVVTLPLMLILFLLAKISQSNESLYRAPAIVLMWGIVAIFIITMFSLFSSVFFQYPLNLCKWLDPNCGKSSNILSVDSLKKSNPVQPNNKEIKGGNNHIKDHLASKKGFSKVIFSIQLNNQTEGYRKIYLNGRSIGVLPESTKFNPRIEIDSFSGTAEIMILTNKGDTCWSNVRGIVDTSIFRIIPNCN